MGDCIAPEKGSLEIKAKKVTVTLEIINGKPFIIQDTKS
jgi:hypothetical protein